MVKTFRWFGWLSFMAVWLASGTSLHANAFGERLNYRFSLFTESYRNWLNDTPLNKDNELLPQIRYGSYSSADVFLNYGRFTTAMKALAHYTDRDASAYRAIIRELYFDHDFSGSFHITIGKKILKWGTGYAFNPCGVIEPGRQASDPSDRREQYQGRQIVAFDAFSGDRSFTLLYANESRYRDTFHRGKHELASRIYALVGGLDLSLISHWKEKEKFKLGVSTAYTYGSHIELHSELIGQMGSTKQYHLVLSDPNFQPIPHSSSYVARYQHSNKIFPRLLVGAQYTFDNGISLMIEYFYNREGLTHQEWQWWRQFVLKQVDATTTVPPDPLSFMNFYDALATLDRSGSMRHYGFCRGYWPQQRFGLELLLLNNLVDGSGVGVMTFNYVVRTNFTGWIRGEFYAGRHASEFGLLFFRSAILLGAKYSF